MSILDVLEGCGNPNNGLYDAVANGLGIAVLNDPEFRKKHWKELGLNKPKYKKKSKRKAKRR